jgi:hypothetical protein
VQIIFLLVGATIPYVVSGMVWTVRLILSRVRARHGPARALIGVWNVYHFSQKEGHTVFRYEIWKIHMNLRGRLAISTQDDRMAGLNYVGYLDAAESGHIICRMRGKGHREEYYIRLAYPIPSDVHLTYGLKVGEDFDHNIFSTMYMFSRRDISIPRARKQLADKLKAAASSTDPVSLVIRPSPTQLPMAHKKI